MTHLTSSRIRQYETVWATDSRGWSYRFFRPLMPRILDEWLESVVYVYPSVADADEGRRSGGTGFLISVPSEGIEGLEFIYAVTNSHVIHQASQKGTPVLRFNTDDGGTTAQVYSTDLWVHHPDNADVAICLVGEISDQVRSRAIPSERFVSAAMCSAPIPVSSGRQVVPHPIGPGDDVYFLGRFMTHEGRQRNLPTARFGNIAMLPWEPIKNPMGSDQESFLVEARSLPGYSGSPVFVFFESYAAFRGHSGTSTALLLGLDWSHLADCKPVLDESRKPLEPKQWVEQNSGMMGVIPAWKLTELLNDEDVVKMRKQHEDEIKVSSDGVVLDNAEDSGAFEQFERLAKGLLSVPKGELDRARLRNDDSKPSSQ